MLMYPSIESEIRRMGTIDTGGTSDLAKSVISKQEETGDMKNGRGIYRDIANGRDDNMVDNGIENMKREGGYEIDFKDNTPTMNMNPETSNTEYPSIQDKSDSTKVITHGFVHGHIHKHKDHTHIHGHIHNHDHDHHRKKEGSEIDPSPLESDVCKEFDEVSFCKDIFCDDLDDCFFLSCDDNKEKDEHVHECDHEHNHDILDPQDLSDSHTPQSDTRPQTLDSQQQADKLAINNLNGFTSSSLHHNNLCDIQLSKKPIFENLINNVHKNVSKITLPSQKLEDAYDPKRRKLNDFELHFPHECHQEESVQQTPQIDDHHHFHQSCFHTTIPNSTTPDPLAESEKIMSDFDFYIQFNNFNQFLNSINQKNPQNETLETQNFEYLNNNLLPASNIESNIPTSNSTNIPTDIPTNLPTSLLQSSSNNSSTTPSTSSPVYSCRWDNCFRKVNDGTLMQHLINQHIDQEYHLNLTTPSINPKKMSYQCEWSDCNYMDNNLDSLIDHLSVHKEELSKRQLMKNQAYTITPISTDKSVNSSPDMSSSYLNSETKPFNSLKSESPMDISPTKHEMKTHIKSEQTNEEILNCDSDLLQNYNITSMKIMPKKKSCSLFKEHDANFTCKWGVTKDGEFGPCNKTHSCEGELQEHLVKDHVGSGKSSYECGWIDCERFHGKKFVQRQKLLRHIHIHTNYRPCKCDICGARFAVDSMLKQHLRIHSGEKPFLCGICGKRFATSSSLSIHNRVHTGERPLVCKWKGCNKRFRESSNLTKHMKIHLKSFKCEVCGDEFNKKPDYTKHVKENSCTANVEDSEETRV